MLPQDMALCSEAKKELFNPAAANIEIRLLMDAIVISESKVQLQFVYGAGSWYLNTTDLRSSKYTCGENQASSLRHKKTELCLIIATAAHNLLWGTAIQDGSILNKVSCCESAPFLL